MGSAEANEVALDLCEGAIRKRMRHLREYFGDDPKLHQELQILGEALDWCEKEKQREPVGWIRPSAVGGLRANPGKATAIHGEPDGEFSLALFVKHGP